MRFFELIRFALGAGDSADGAGDDFDDALGAKFSLHGADERHKHARFDAAAFEEGEFGGAGHGWLR